MKFPTLIPAGIVAGILLAGAGANAQQLEQLRTIGVNGQGEVRAEPDRATVTLGASQNWKTRAPKSPRPSMQS